MWHVSWHPVALSLALPIIPITPMRVKDDQSFYVWHCTCVRAPSSALTEARIGRNRSPSGQVYLSGQAKTPSQVRGSHPNIDTWSPRVVSPIIDVTPLPVRVAQ